MEAEKKSKKRLWRLIPLALLLLAVGGSALVYLAGSRGLSADADDPRAIQRVYDSGSYHGASLEADGTMELRFEKADLYWFARKYGLTQPVRDWLSLDPRLLSGGFRLSGESVTISIRRRAGGLLPLSYRAEAGVVLRDGALCLEVRKVWLGSHMPLRESQWPSLFRQELRVELSGTELAPGLLAAELSGGELRLRYAALTGSREGSLSQDRSVFAALRLFGREETACPVPWEDGAVTTAALCRAAVESGDALGYLPKAMSLCEEEDLSLLWQNDSALVRQWLWEPLTARARELRQELAGTLAERQKPYEKLLIAVREIYRSGAMGIWETGFYNPATGEAVHPGTLSKLPITAIDSRIVFLTTAGDEAAPEEMPDMLTVPRKIWRTMDKDLDWKADVDLGVLLTTEGEVPILLYRRGDGTLMLREVTEELYVSAMVSRSIPQLDLDSLPPMAQAQRPAGEGFTGAVIAFLQSE